MSQTTSIQRNSLASGVLRKPNKECRRAAPSGGDVLGANEVGGGAAVDGGGEDEGGALDAVDRVDVVLPPHAKSSPTRIISCKAESRFWQCNAC